MKDKAFCLRLKGSSPTFREKPTLVLHQYFFMAIRLFQLNLTPTYSIYLLTTYYPQKGLNLLSLQRLDSYVRSSKFQFPSLLGLLSLYSFIFISFFVRYLVSSKYTKFSLYLDFIIFTFYMFVFIYIVYIYICVYIYIVKSFPACSFTKYKIEKNYIIFSQDVSNCICIYIFRCSPD